MPPLITSNVEARMVVASEELVEALLAMNTRNRSPKLDNIRAMAQDMLTGRFYATASGVGVSKTGVLLDGQNRLLALRRADYPPVQFVLATGLEDESQMVIDGHARRMVSDSLTMMMDTQISTRMVALARALKEFNGAKGKSEPFGVQATMKSIREIAEFMAEHGALTAEVVSASGGARAPVAAAIFVYAFHNRDAALVFADKVHRGIELQEDEPAYRLRLLMEKASLGSGSASARMATFKYAASACIADAKGLKLKQLKQSESWATAPWSWALALNGATQ